MSSRATALVCSLALWSAAAGACRPDPDRVGAEGREGDRAARSVEDEAVASLAAFEAERLASTDFARRTPAAATLGPDPYVVVRAPQPPEQRGARAGWIGLLRGADAVVLLDEGLREIDRAPAPALASALVVTPRGEVLAGGEASGELRAYRVVRGRFEATAPLDLQAGAGRRGIRAMAAHPSGTIYAVDEANDALIVVPDRSRPHAREPFALPVAEGPIRVVATAHHVVVASLIGHVVTAIPVDRAGLPDGDAIAIRRDGPPWSVAAIEQGDDLVIATGGVEDHPLDRTGGSFAHVDPFLFVDRVRDGRVAPLHRIDLGERGVITPKALAWTDGGARLGVAGYGSSRGLRLSFSATAGAVDHARTPTETAFDLPPGAASLAAGDDGELVAANPLYDAFVRVGSEAGDVTLVRPSSDRRSRSDASRLGEALFFTSLLAPWQKSDGELSRFTCETCHFEGGVDGRVHATGRGDVHATTKPLVGLFGNGPHFTRALDHDLAHMVHAEFRVASARLGHEPWFELDEAARVMRGEGRDWLDQLVDRRALDGSPEGLRRAFMAFLMDFTPPPNPAAMGRDAFDPLEGEGADVFARDCAGCHAPRLIAADPGSAVPRAGWTDHIFGTDGRTAGAIVWARDGYEQTGVRPYVHADGARPTSLRRLARKRPYFSNGSARTLEAVIDAVRFDEAGALHHASEPAAVGAAGDRMRRLEEHEQRALLAFLRLL